MKRREFIKAGAGAFAIASAGRVFGVVASSARSTMMVHLGNIAAQTGEAVKTDPATGRLLPGSAGAEFWGRKYEKGWELV